MWPAGGPRSHGVHLSGRSCVATASWDRANLEPGRRAVGQISCGQALRDREQRLTARSSAWAGRWCSWITCSEQSRTQVDRLRSVSAGPPSTHFACQLTGTPQTGSSGLLRGPGRPEADRAYSSRRSSRRSFCSAALRISSNFQVPKAPVRQERRPAH